MKTGIVITVVLAGALACHDGGPKPIDTAGIEYPCTDMQTGLSRPCRALWLVPGPGERGSVVLLGDSVAVRAFSDSAFTVSSWVAGPALGVSSASTGSLMWASALAVGSATITANAFGGRSATTTITIVDSSAITSLTAPATYSETIRAGAAFLQVYLRDATGREVAATPQWSASNNALVSIKPQTYSAFGYYYPGAYVTLKATGSVTLTVTYRNLSANIQLFITP